MPIIASFGAAAAQGFGQRAGAPKLFVTAAGGTITTSGDFKIHTFTGPGTFCVSCAGNEAGSTQFDYTVVAGGGSGGGAQGYGNAGAAAGGGGGAGAPTGTAGTVNTGSGAGGGSAPGNTGG